MLCQGNLFMPSSKEELLRMAHTMRHCPAEVAHATAELAAAVLPLWTAVMLGLIIGWAWRPRWAALLLLALRRPNSLFPTDFSVSRLWLAATAISVVPILRSAFLAFQASGTAKRNAKEAADFQARLERTRFQLRIQEQSSEQKADAWREERSVAPAVVEDSREIAAQAVSRNQALAVAVSEELEAEKKRTAVNQEDVSFFRSIVASKERGDGWQKILCKRTETVAFEAWRRDPEDGGPTQYVTSTTVEGVEVELARDFFWDDEFRMSSNWDNMLTAATVLQVCARTGEQLVHWVRRFPFFCSPRDYVLARRQFVVNDGGSDGQETEYYCITKTVEAPHAPPTPARVRRVTDYFSSWRIRSVPSLNDGTPGGASETVFVHAEDMLIQRDIAKLGVRQGMWGCVKRIEPGMRQYFQKIVQQRAPPSEHARFMHSYSSRCLAIPAVDGDECSSRVQADGVDGSEDSRRWCSNNPSITRARSEPALRRSDGSAVSLTLEHIANGDNDSADDSSLGSSPRNLQARKGKRENGDAGSGGSVSGHEFEDEEEDRSSIGSKEKHRRKRKLHKEEPKRRPGWLGVVAILGIAAVGLEAGLVAAVATAALQKMQERERSRAAGSQRRLGA